MTEPWRILLLGDSPDPLIERALRGEAEADVVRVPTAAALSAVLALGPYDALLATDEPLGAGAAELVALVRRSGQELPVILVAGAWDVAKVVAALRDGVADCVGLGELDRLRPVVEREVRGARDRRGRRAAETAMRDGHARTLSLLTAFGGLLLRLDGAGRVLERAGEADHDGLTWPRAGQHVRETLPPPLADALLADARAVVAGEPREVCYRGLSEAGPVWFEASLAAGADDEVVVLLRDITEQRRLEEQGRQSHRLEEVGRLAGGVAHDFNNLLQVVLSYAEFVGRGLPEDHPVQEDLAQILAAARRGASLVRQLLAFSRQQPVEPERLGLNQVLEELRKFLARSLGEDITVQLDLEPALPAIRISPSELQQVLLNLAVNARDAMPAGGVLTLRTRTAAPGEVRLEVGDTGTGMPPEVAAHVFDPYFTTKEEHGSGLGLATVFGIVRQAGGRIELDTAPGRGATFRLCFPAVVGAGAPASRPVVARVDAGRDEVVLLIEDEQLIRAGVARVLSAHGYRVVTAASGEEALELAPRLPRLDLLVADVVMTGLSGPEVAERLAAARPGLRVLFISGYGDQHRLSAHHFNPPGLTLLPKPFRPQELLAHVRRALDGERVRANGKLA